MKNNRVILVTVDSLRFDRLKKMSHLYSLKDKTLFYNNCYTAGEPTELSFPAILGSIYPSQAMSTVCFPDNRRTIAEVLKDNFGFNTYAINDGNPWCSSFTGYKRGFKYINDYLFGKVLKKTFFSRFIKNCLNIFYPKHLRAFISPYMFKPRTHIKEIIDEGIKILKRDDKKIFLWMHFMDVHSPYRLGSIPFDLRNISCIKTYSKLSSIPNKVKITQEDKLNITRMYDLSVRFFDIKFKKFLSFYFKNEYEKGTSLIITADHGEELGERNNFFHMENVFEEVTHVPFMIFGKSLKLKEINDYCSLRDIPKTILGLIGVDDDYFFGNNILKDYSEYSISETLKPCMNILMDKKSFKEGLKLKLKSYIYAYYSSDKTIFFDNIYLDKDFKQLDSKEVPQVFRDHAEKRYE